MNFFIINFNFLLVALQLAHFKNSINLTFEKMYRIIVCFALMIFLFSEINGQGCSDAGFCTMGAMKPDQAYSRDINFKLRSVEFNYYRGKTTLSPVVTVYTADISFGINDKTSFQLKLPYQHVKGNFGTNEGIGDISFSASRSIGRFKGYNVGITLGGKVPSGYGSDNASGRASTFGTGQSQPGDLPMYYQVSLGTYDVVAGASMINAKWLFATGIQIPVKHQNNNTFLWGNFAEYPGGQEYVQEYNRAVNLERGTDIMLRAERNFRFLNYNFSFGALPIYRITKDRTLDPETGELVKRDGTTGMALSVLASAGYNFNVNSSFKLIFGYKLTDREFNPDGLTRDNVISVSYIYKFL